MHRRRSGRAESGQSLVEFAISSVVLVLLFGGLIDLSLALHDVDVLHNAAREGARVGSVYSTGYGGNPYYDDADIKAAVNRVLTAAGLNASLLRNTSSLTCPPTADGNPDFNPPYLSSYLPTVSNQPWLYICYNQQPGKDLPLPQPPNQPPVIQELNVILLMAYGPLTSFIPAPLPGGFTLAANVHHSAQP
ncbi:MAG: hypothetical protein NVS9B1_03020 [Candidatus Dormibacteraceae bacterium]